MKTYRQCQKCGETIQVISESWLQELFRYAFLNLKCHIHYKKHDVKYLSNKGIIKSILWIILSFIIWVMLAPIYYITLPFWWLHEKIS